MRLTRVTVQFPGEESASTEYEVKTRASPWGPQDYVELHLEPALLEAGESVTFTMDWQWNEAE